MERNENSFSSSRKRRNPEDPESQFDVMKQENERLKELIKQQQNLIGKQALKIYQLKEENDFRLVEIDDIHGKDVEEELRSKNLELEQKFEDEKIKFEKELADLMDQVINLEKQNESKNEKIKDLEEQLSTILSIKSDPDYSTEAMQKRIDELESSCDKKVKDLQSQLQKSEEERSLLQDRFNECEEKIAELKAQLESKTNVETSLHTKIAKMKQDSVEYRKFLDSEIDRFKAEKVELKSSVENLTKKISEEQNSATLMQNNVDELNGIITVAKANEQKLQSKIKELNEEIRSKNSELEQRIEEYRNAQVQNQIDNLPRFLTVDEVRDGDKLSIDQLCCNNIAIVKVSKFILYQGVCYLSTAADSNVRFDFNSRKSCFKFQITGELKIESVTAHVEKLIPLIHSCSLTKLDCSFNLNFDHFLKFASSHTIKTFMGGFVQRQEGRNTVFLGIHEIMKELPNVEICEIKHVERAEDCQKLGELSTFTNLQKFKCCLRDPFDISSFDGFIAKHPHVEFMFEIKLMDPSSDLERYADFIKKHPTARFLFKFEKLRCDEKIMMPTKLIAFRKLFPSTCKVVVEY